jgi:hypothetical protein
MIALAQPNINFTPDQQVKITAAVKQMTQLLAEVDQWIKYRLLSRVDRERLITKGFARDLVDNLVYVTQRLQEGQPDKDELTIGFTSDAFDPSLYACKVVFDALQKNSRGCCSWCESYLEHSQPQVSHFRPAAGYIDNNNIYRTAYYSLAYEQSNLFYSCWACSELYKADQFPTIDGDHAPHVSHEAEKPALINPYVENPRNTIRFNPLNAMVYDFETTCIFYQTQGKSKADVEALIWQDPANIPLQKSIKGEPLSLPEVDSAYDLWLSKNESQGKKSRGAITIEVLGLNREALVYSRAYYLSGLWAHYVKQASNTTQASDDKERNKKPVPDGIQYASMSIDAINTWQKATNASALAQKA